MPLGHQVAERIVVTQRLGHLLPLHHEELGMQPEARKEFAGERLRLRDLVLVVRENQVPAAGVYVQGLPQVVDRHDGTLDVPAGTPRSDGSVPEWLALLGCLPERKIARVGLFVLIDIHPGAGQIAAEIVVRKLAVRRKTGDLEVDRTLGGVGVLAYAQLLDRRHHLGIGPGARPQPFRPLQAQRGAIFQEGVRIDLRILGERLVRRHGVADDLVVHVGDVHHVVQLEAVGAQTLAQQVHEREGAEVADVGKIVHRGSAGVHADGVVARRCKFLHLLRQRVIEAQRHNNGKLSSYQTGQCARASVWSCRCSGERAGRGRWCRAPRLPMTSYLIDSNVWLALTWEQHPLHISASRWYASMDDSPLLFCRFTMLGFLRLLTHGQVMGDSTNGRQRAPAERPVATGPASAWLAEWAIKAIPFLLTYREGEAGLAAHTIDFYAHGDLLGQRKIRGRGDLDGDLVDIAREGAERACHGCHCVGLDAVDVHVGGRCADAGGANGYG